MLWLYYQYSVFADIVSLVAGLREPLTTAGHPAKYWNELQNSKSLDVIYQETINIAKTLFGVILDEELDMVILVVITCGLD